MRKIMLIVLIAATVAGCAKRKNFHEFDGQNFRASARGERADREAFNVSVRGLSKSEDGAREAGRYEGTKYCIKRFGTSLITWEAGPDDEVLSTDGDTLLLSGRCVQ